MSVDLHWFGMQKLFGAFTIQFFIELFIATIVQFYLGRVFYVAAWKAITHKAANMEV